MLSMPHLVILFVIALLVFGPEKLPELARMLGKAMAEFRRVTTDVRRVVEDEMRDIELKTREADLRKREAELSAEREKSIMPPGGGATQASGIMSGNAPPEGQAQGTVEGTVQSDRPNNLAAESEPAATLSATPTDEGNSDVDANHS
jgi:sec-independent protein translocase protein TatB